MIKHVEAETPKLHINWTRVSGYMARLHRPYARKWECQKMRRTLPAAMREAATLMATGKYNCADVIMCPPSRSYYGPTPVYTMRKF